MPREMSDASGTNDGAARPGGGGAGGDGGDGGDGGAGGELTFAGFQKHIADRYATHDRARGTPGTWLHFSEEIGELARALARNDDRANLEEEFADVVAWLCTLANINDVDLASAVARKYLSANRPQGHK